MPVIHGAPLVQSDYGLLGKASEVVTPSDSTWVGTFTHPIVDADVALKNIVARGGGAVFSDTVHKTEDRTPSYLEYTPFFIESKLPGSVMEPDAEGKKDRVRELLEISKQKSIEHEVWSGVLSAQVNTEADQEFAKNRFLNDPSTPGYLSLSDVAVSVDDGLSLLEEAFGDHTIGYQGVIHAPRRVASRAKIREYLKDGYLRTNLGTPVIAGTGYSKIGSDYWMFGTSPMTIVLGDVEVMPDNISQAVNTRNNNIEYIAQMPVGVFWTSEKLFAVKVDPTL